MKNTQKKLKDFRLKHQQLNISKKLNINAPESPIYIFQMSSE